MNSQSIDPAFDFVEMPVKNIQAFQTTLIEPNGLNKINGLNSSVFQYFNLGLHVGDNANQVQENRHHLLNYLPKASSIQWLDQVHGNHVEFITTKQLTPPKADAVITSSEKLALAIMTADCLPIILANRDGTEIAAIHAGWRPLATDIIKRTLTKMKSSSSHLYAWLGPCISQENFEVGSEVKLIFEQLDSKFAKAFKAGGPNKWLADLRLIAVIMLEMQGVKNIKQKDACTFAQSKRYYSFRRENKTGRMATVICIK